MAAARFTVPDPALTTIFPWLSIPASPGLTTVFVKSSTPVGRLVIVPSISRGPASK